MPAGFEFTESVNGVVSVRRVDSSPRLIPEADVEAARREVLRHKHLGHHLVAERKNEIIIYEPVGRLSDEDVARLAELGGMKPRVFAGRIADFQARARYAPVMKFVPAGFRASRRYVAYRMTYRGEGGWWPLASGRLGTLLKAYVRHIGTDAFYELL